MCNASKIDGQMDIKSSLPTVISNTRTVLAIEITGSVWSSFIFMLETRNSFLELFKRLKIRYN